MSNIPAVVSGRNSIRRTEAWWASHAYDGNYRRFAREFLCRQIIGLLTPAETVILIFLFDRTVEWCKDWERVRMSQFVSGTIPKLDGSQTYRGTGMSERTVRDTLKVLVADGLVQRRDVPGGRGLQEYALCEVWRFGELPRFAGVNLRFSAPYGNGEDVEICSPGAAEPAGVGSNVHALTPANSAGVGGAKSAAPNICLKNTCKKHLSDASGGASLAASTSKPIGRVSVLDEGVLAAAMPVALRASARASSLPLLNARAVAGAKRDHAASASRIAAAWSSACRKVTGAAAPTPAGRTRGRLKIIAAHHTPAEPSVSWVDVATWAAGHFGFALSLSVPFLLEDRDKRDDLLSKPPQLGLFACYADAFADAYIRLHHGEGFRSDLIGNAEAAQRAHDKWMKRLRIAGQRGYDALPVALQTAGEVLAHATPDDPVVERAMAERQALQAIAHATRGDGPAREARADQAVRTERARLRVIEGTGAREAKAQDLGLPTYSENPDDYYNDF